MLYVLIIICVASVAYLFYVTRSYQDEQQALKKINQSFSQRGAALKKENVLLNNITQRINLTSNHPFFSHNQMRIMCIRAGIRSSDTQKLIILMRYLLIIPGALLAILIGYYVANTQNIDYDIKLIFMAGIIGGIVGHIFPKMRVEDTIKIRQAAISQAFPDFIDIMNVCIGAGMTAEQAYVKVQANLEQISAVLAAEISILSSELTYFLDPSTAYKNLYNRTQNEYIKAYSSIIMQSLKFGTPLSVGLKSLSDETREKQMGEMEKKAASLPSKLTLPMMIFTLPVLFVVIGYPAAVRVMQAF